MPRIKKKNKQYFITFEGIDGCGKTTHAVLAYEYLSSLGYKCKLLREPGSTKVAEKIRKILLDKRNNINDTTELLLYEASRAEIINKEIKPLLNKGNIVLCDRFYDSTTAYQGYGRKLDIRMVRSLHKIATGGLIPNLTLLFDLDLDLAFSRSKKNKDRLESQSKQFFKRVRKGFLEIARIERRRIKVIDASRSIEDVFVNVTNIINRKLKIND